MAIILVVISSLLFASTRVLYKLSLTRHSSIAILAISQTTAGLIAIPILFLNPPSGSFSLPLLILQSALWIGFMFCEINSLKYLDVGVAAILAAGEYIFHLLLGYFFFHDTLRIIQLEGCALVLLGIFIASEWSSVGFRRGALWQLGAVLCLVLALPVDVVLVKQLNPWFAAGFAYVGPAMFLLTSNTEARRTIQSSLLKPSLPLLAGMVNLTGYILLLTAFNMTTYTVSVTGYQLTLVFTLMLGWIVLKERTRLVQKAVAVILVVGGVLLCASA